MKLLTKYYILLIAVTVLLPGCSDLLEPEVVNNSTFDRVYKDPDFAEGLLMNAYNKLPTLSYSFNDVATDDAVSNDKFNSYQLMATGQWSAQYNPMSNWVNMNKGVLYLNKFIPIVDSITWYWNSEEVNAMFKVRLTGEAYAMRGVLRYYLLQNIAGRTANGKMLGIPLFNDFLDTDANFNMSRADFDASVAAINSDFDKANEYLPMDFRNLKNINQLPAEFSTVNLTNYNLVFGDVSNQRISKRIVLGFKARLDLLSASPAFNTNQDVNRWENAANSTAEVLNLIPSTPGLAGLDAKGHTFYVGSQVNSASITSDQKEMLWRGNSNALSSNLEKRMLPPGLNGNGEVNPTQNLVDAFPMKNGYPISNLLSGYDVTNPYANRDPRLALYILYNGATLQTKVINTGKGGGVNAKDSLTTSTRTGYYLRKLIREDVVFSADGSTTPKKHYAVHMRYTELFMNYAEAANEAWGPDGKGAIASYSAKDVIAAIRKRAGITQPDNYLNSISSKEEMRELIRNERRIELCFEGFRFWDIRRWGLPLNETTKGVIIENDNATFNYVNIEPRVYKPYMQYAPLPEQEVLKFPGLEQNAGW
ncbi:MAG TPA: RagB/SusD family nutrient uptake outer membrane protein [Marinilabiliales bacterium]|nr:RagB/SusD family nutrient uptake outer membrane protein [Marinilabiliales bacterium]